MANKSPLKDKLMLVVDDEPDILESVEEELDMCFIHKAENYETALHYLSNHTYDMVILDIMGVNGFELLKVSVAKGFPTIMLTAHAITLDALKKSIKLGAVFFLPKEKLFELKDFLEEVVLQGGGSIWASFFGKLGNYFIRRFGPDWKKKDKFFKEFEASLNLGSKE